MNYLCFFIIFLVVLEFLIYDFAILISKIYIFHEDNVYAPMRLDSIGNQQLYMRNYLYIFADAVPKKEQIIAEEFDLQIIVIYEQEELDRLYAEGILVKIYGP